jgi:DNA-binding MarR family transcriptional regulator
MSMALTIIPQLHKATHQIALFIDRHRDELGVSQAEAHVLAFLSEAGPCSIAELHRSFGHRRSTLTSILNRLEKRALLKREVHPKDRRSYLLRLTATGRPLATKVHRHIERLEQRVAKAVGSKPLAGFLATASAIEAAADDEG